MAELHQRDAAEGTRAVAGREHCTRIPSASVFNAWRSIQHSTAGLGVRQRAILYRRIQIKPRRRSFGTCVSAVSTAHRFCPPSPLLALDWPPGLDHLDPRPFSTTRRRVLSGVGARSRPVGATRERTASSRLRMLCQSGRSRRVTIPARPSPSTPPTWKRFGRASRPNAAARSRPRTRCGLPSPACGREDRIHPRRAALSHGDAIDGNDLISAAHWKPALPVRPTPK